MEPELSPRQRLEQAIVSDPHDLSNYSELDDILCNPANAHPSGRTRDELTFDLLIPN